MLVLLYAGIILGTVLIDQITKFITDNGASFSVVSDLLRVEPVRNPGMAFGMLSDWKYAQTMFSVITVIILVAVVVYLFKTTNRSKTLHTAIAFMVGGTLGNFIDRLALKEVRDFLALDLRIKILQFNCNMADVFITVGAVLFIVYCLFLDKDAIFKRKGSADKPKKDE